MAADAFKALTVSFKAGERIVGAGEHGACMFVINAGRVKLFKPASSPGGGGVEVGLLEKGDFFGEQALLDGRSYGVNADADSDCDVVEIGPSVFNRMLKANPEIAVRMLRKLATRLEKLEGLMVNHGTAQTLDSDVLKQDPESAPTPPPRLERVSQGRLVMEGGSAVFPLRGTEMLVGRYDPVTEIQPEIDLTGVDTKRSVSRRHSRLSRDGDQWQVEEEVGALNGTFVNGARLATGRRASLREGDVISFGMVRVVFRET